MLLTNQNIRNLKVPEPHQPGGTARVTFTLISESIGLDPHPVSQELQCRASLVAQWLRICLPMQGTRVRALVWEDPTCRRATRPVSHNY